MLKFFWYHFLLLGCRPMFVGGGGVSVCMCLGVGVCVCVCVGGGGGGGALINRGSASIFLFFGGGGLYSTRYE